jgi:hypothetical protein
MTRQAGVLHKVLNDIDPHSTFEVCFRYRAVCSGTYPGIYSITLAILPKPLGQLRQTPTEYTAQPATATSGAEPSK